MVGKKRAWCWQHWIVDSPRVVWVTQLCYSNTSALCFFSCQNELICLAGNYAHKGEKCWIAKAALFRIWVFMQWKEQAPPIPAPDSSTSILNGLENLDTDYFPTIKKKKKEISKKKNKHGFYFPISKTVWMIQTFLIFIGYVYKVMPNQVILLMVRIEVVV